MTQDRAIHAVEAQSPIPWVQAMSAALYSTDPQPPSGPGPGFFIRERPADHFTTSAMSPVPLAGALSRLAQAMRIRRVIDLGAGGGELATALASDASLVVAGVDFAPRPPGLPAEVGWHRTLSEALANSGDNADAATDVLPASDSEDHGALGGAGWLVFANEYLDNVPLDVAECDVTGTLRLVLVDPTTGNEQLGPPLAQVDSLAEEWAHRWWPNVGSGDRVEIGLTRDRAWREVVATVQAAAPGSVAIAVDYAHTAAERPQLGSLTGYRQGRQVHPVPDGSCDITAHVALDSVASALADAGSPQPFVLSQREVLAALGVRADLPNVEIARSSPASYARQLVAANQSAALLDPAGLGGFTWLLCGHPTLGWGAGAGQPGA